MAKRKPSVSIATREERQRFWTSVMMDESVEWPQRLRASELLARSQADFLDRREITGVDGGPVAITSWVVEPVESSGKARD